MKFFRNNNLFKKTLWVVIMMIMIQALSLIVPVESYAEGDGTTADEMIVIEEWQGGSLVTPVVSLVRYIGKGLTELIHQSIMGHEAHIDIDLTSKWDDALPWIKAFVAGALVIAAAVAVVVAFPAVAGYLTVGSILTVVHTAVGVGAVVGYIAKANLPNGYLMLPAYSLSAEEIFKGKIPMLDVNFFNPTTEKMDDDRVAADALANDSLAGLLQETVSRWYVLLRNIALILMMSILLYIGIKILLSSLALDKAKYKELLMDWVVGMCLLFFMHYIMVFSVTLVEMVTDLLGSTNDNIFVTGLADTTGKIGDAVEAFRKEDPSFWEDEYVEDPEVDGYVLYWNNHNIMSRMMLESQLVTGNALPIGYTICYLVLIMFTICFLFTYIRRVIYLAFLTMIAPLVAMTYPIDKSVDGAAQGFDKWLKEYIFNLLIQPLHLLLYTILIGSVFQFSSENVIYALIALGSMIPTEKLLRTLFGFEKSSTSGSLASAAAGGAMLMGTVGKLGALGKAGKNINKGIDSGSSQSLGGGDDDNGYIRQSQKTVSAMDVLGKMGKKDDDGETKTKTEGGNTKTDDNNDESRTNKSTGKEKEEEPIKQDDKTQRTQGGDQGGDQGGEPDGGTSGERWF